jgi:hypothetical protein
MYGIDGLARKTNNPLNVSFFCAAGVVLEADCVSNLISVDRKESKKRVESG